MDKPKVFLEDWGSGVRSGKAFLVNKTVNTLFPRPGDWLTQQEVTDILLSNSKDVYIERHKTKGEK